MYQCSKKNAGIYPIRPHHGMCLAFFIGNGYSTGFTAHMQEMLELFTKGADVCLTVKTDEICSACPNNSQGICEAAEKVKRYDNAVLAECGLKEGQKLAFPESTEAVQKKIIETGATKIHMIKQWNRICQEQPSRWKVLMENTENRDIQHFAESGSCVLKIIYLTLAFY